MSEDVFGIVGTTQGGVFRVERVVAEGGFAVVYRAYHEGFRAPVALKCLKVPDTMSDAQRAVFLEKFRTEGELLFQLSSLVPAVVRPLHIDVLVLGERIVPFLALEWLDGEALDQIVDKRRDQGKPPLGIRTLVPFLQPAAHALAQAHEVPGPDGPIAIIHRDIKPENIFVARAADGETVKILDFGIARTRSAAQLDAGAMTSATALDSFTPGYAAPEQWMPKRFGQIGPWTDVYCLALTMVEALTGKPPLEGDFSAMAQGTTNPVVRPTPRTLGATVPDAVEAAFVRALAVDPRQRTRTIGGFWTELENALGLPPSIQVKDTRTNKRARSLSEASEPPPPMPSTPTSTPSRASSLRATEPAPASLPLRVRQAEGDLPPGLAREAPAARFDLEGPGDRGGPASGFHAAPAIKVVRPRRERGTLAPQHPPVGRKLSELRDQLRTPITLFIAAVAIAAGDAMYTKSTGELFHLGPVRPVWLTGTLALTGVVLACWRVFVAVDR